ncbi:MAG: ABC transporter permease [Bacteroidales bacterium]|nr:ABC transporter permease [Bacteroidales bacterium]
MDELRSWLNYQVNTYLRKLRLKDAGIEESEMKDLFTWIHVEGLQLVSLDEGTVEIGEARKASEVDAIIIPIAFMMLLILMIMMSLPGMLHSVMEEKTQRIAEVLLGSLKPFEFMMAKLVRGIAVSLTSSAVYVIGVVVTVNYLGYNDYLLYHVLPWFFIYTDAV